MPDLAGPARRAATTPRAVGLTSPATGESSGMTKRETIEPNPGDKRYVRRDDDGQFTDDQVDVGRSAAADQRQHSDTPTKPGEGDKGDRPS